MSNYQLSPSLWHLTNQMTPTSWLILAVLAAAKLRGEPDFEFPATVAGSAAPWLRSYDLVRIVDQQLGRITLALTVKGIEAVADESFVLRGEATR